MMTVPREQVARAACLTTGLIVASLVPGAEEAIAQSDPLPGDPAETVERASRRDAEDALRARVDDLECRRWREDDEPFDFGAIAAIHCAAPSPGIGQLALFAFPDAASLADFWAWRIDRIDPAPAEREGACADARPGFGMWARGRVVCFVEDGRAKSRWVDDETLTYGIADATDIHVGSLYRWWAGRDPSAIRETGADPRPGAVAADFSLDPRLPSGRRQRIDHLLTSVADPRHRDTDRKATTRRCRPLRPQRSASLEPLSIAGIECEPTRRGKSRYRLSEPVRYFLFPSDAALAEWWRRWTVGEPDQPMDVWSGSFGACFDIAFVEMSGIGGETAWISEDGSRAGRVACRAPRAGRARQSLRWTVAPDLVGGTLARSRDLFGPSRGEWFTAVHPHRLQAYPEPAGDERVTPFADPDAMHRLPVYERTGEPLGTEPPPGPSTLTREPSSHPGLPLGVVQPVIIEPCFGNAGFPPDVDGTFWQAIGGVGPDGRRIRWGQGLREFPEGAVVDFLKITEDEAQVRAAGGSVVAYERHDGPRRYLVGCS